MRKRQIRKCLICIRSNDTCRSLITFLLSNREVFFVPYVWDVIVGTLTTTTMEWSRNKIQVFPLNEDLAVEVPPNENLEEGFDISTSDAVTHENTADVV